LPAVAPDTLHLPTPQNYRLLQECDVQCLAVRAAALANTLDRERQELAAKHPPPKDGLAQLLPCQCHARENWLRQLILYYTALEDRNRSAGRALELYFKAAETEALAELLDRSRADLQNALRRGDDLTARGFKLPVDLATLRRQLLDADADRARAQGGLFEINSRLKELVGLGEVIPDDWVWPAVECPVQFDPADVDAAIATALAKRPELILLRVIDQELDAKTLPVIREYLKTLNALIGSRHEPELVIVKVVEDCLLARGAAKALRDGQLASIIAERERQVANEVRLAAAALATKARLVALSRERVLTAEGRRRDAAARVGQGGGSFLEVLSTSLEWYKARATLTTDVMGWHTARVQLKQAQGLLVWECCPECCPAGK
jgi:hypothetical protein